ncbi:(2Fe-2S)-binding protein [Planococcus beigongshangi]|uniref:(2Fe-2S)-binding protein n=1 Tax=Planococcus beigongshangi TaxID=2782536 RepID=UPI00193B2CE0|nr:(2Fe-2S)-binding protein [Planococcus beigongshangi]
MYINDHPLLESEFLEEITFFYEGKQLIAKSGQTVAAALMGNGIKVFGVSRKLQQPRGVFCANGRCCSCFVTIDGLDHTLSCMTRIEEGMQVFFNGGDPVVGRGGSGI